MEGDGGSARPNWAAALAQNGRRLASKVEAVGGGREGGGGAQGLHMS